MYEIFCHHSYFHQLYISTNFSLKDSFSFLICGSLWFGVFYGVSEGMWLNKFGSFFCIEIGGNLLGGVGSHSFLLFGFNLEESSVGWLWFGIVSTESWNSVSDSGRPVLEIKSFFSFVGLSNGWLIQLN